MPLPVSTVRKTCRAPAIARIATLLIAQVLFAPLVTAQDTPASSESIIDATRQIDAYITPSLAARIAAMPRNLPRAEAPPVAASVEAARAALDACAARNVLVSVLVADSTGGPVVLLSGDGAGIRSQLIAQTKVNIVIRYGRPSSEVAAEAQANPALIAEALADPDIGMLRGGGLPIMRDGHLIGAIAVSGAGLGGNLDLDEECARAGLSRLASAHD